MMLWKHSLCLLALVCVLQAAVTSAAAPSQAQQNVLTALATNFPYLVDTLNWSATDASTACSTPWTGITCSGTPSITIIDLSAYALTGSFPASISALSSLTMLSVGGGAISGSLPTLPSGLVSIVLSGNAMTSTLDALTDIASLATVDLSNNQFSGTLPTFAGAITTLYLQNNNLELCGGGTVPNTVTQCSVKGQAASTTCECASSYGICAQDGCAPTPAPFVPIAPQSPPTAPQSAPTPAPQSVPVAPQAAPTPPAPQAAPTPVPAPVATPTPVPAPVAVPITPQSPPTAPQSPPTAPQAAPVPAPIDEPQAAPAPEHVPQAAPEATPQAAPVESPVATAPTAAPNVVIEPIGETPADVPSSEGSPIDYADVPDGWIQPIGLCVAGSAATYEAPYPAEFIFSYTSNLTGPVTIPVGTQNQVAAAAITGTSVAVGQPITFYPGTHLMSMRVNGFLSAAVTWNIGNYSVTITPPSQTDTRLVCPTGAMWAMLSFTNGNIDTVAAMENRTHAYICEMLAINCTATPDRITVDIVTAAVRRDGLWFSDFTANVTMNTDYQTLSITGYAMMQRLMANLSTPAGQEALADVVSSGSTLSVVSPDATPAAIRAVYNPISDATSPYFGPRTPWTYYTLTGAQTAGVVIACIVGVGILIAVAVGLWFASKPARTTSSAHSNGAASSARSDSTNGGTTRGDDHADEGSTDDEEDEDEDDDTENDSEAPSAEESQAEDSQEESEEEEESEQEESSEEESDSEEESSEEESA